MKTAALLKRTPTFIVVAFLAYACYSIHASLPDSSAGRTELANGLDLMVKDVVHASTNEVRSLTKVMLRDPFRLSLKAADAPNSKTAEASDDAEAESLARFVSGLKLDATFLQGQTRIAIIDGHIYHQGEHLIVKGETGNSHSPLLIQTVQPQLVTLSARGKTYELGYPDQLGNRPAAGHVDGRVAADGSMAEVDPEGQLAFYKRLLNSPLGKLGLGVLGNQAGTSSKSGRSRGRHGTAAGSSP